MMEDTKIKGININHSSPQTNPSISSQNGKSKQAPDTLEKIRYLPSEIKISKSGGKRTASAMCSFQRKQFVAKPKDDIKHRSVSESTDGKGSKDENLKIKPSGSTSSTCSNITFSDVGIDCPQNNDDVMSTISDVSDLSVMSLNPSSLEVRRKFRRQKQYMSRYNSISKENQVIRENIVPQNNLFATHQKGLSK